MTASRSSVSAGGALSCLLAGCNLAGPAALSSGRPTYNAVINATEDEQLLAMIVHTRYDETFGMLAVSNVTATIRIGASVGGNVGIGSQSSYQGNLVPLSVGATYEENPTITYVPLRGGEFVERVLTPISLQQALLLTRASTPNTEVLRLVVRRVNGVTNSLYSPAASPERFDRFADLYALLRENGVLDIVQPDKVVYEMLLHDYAQDYAAQVRELLATLGINRDISGGGPISLPMTMSVGAPRSDGLNLETPCVLDLVRAAGLGVEVPREHLERGIARPETASEAAQEGFITIHASKSRPDDAAVAVAHAGWWYSVDARDARSKQGFMFLRALVGMLVDHPGPGEQAPILTIPVSR